MSKLAEIEALLFVGEEGITARQIPLSLLSLP